MFTFISVLALFCGTEESDSVAYLCGSCVAVLISEQKRTKTYLGSKPHFIYLFKRSIHKKTETELYLWRVYFSLHLFTQHGAQGTVQNCLTVSYKFRMTYIRMYALYVCMHACLDIKLFKLCFTCNRKIFLPKMENVALVRKCVKPTSIC